MTAELIWRARSNGVPHKSGWGYRLEVPTEDRDAWFDRNWGAVFIELPSAGAHSKIVRINVQKRSFWLGTTHQLHSSEFGEWLLKEKLAPWPKGSPPKLKVAIKGGGHFRVIGAVAP